MVRSHPKDIKKAVVVLYRIDAVVSRWGDLILKMFNKALPPPLSDENLMMAGIGRNM